MALVLPLELALDHLLLWLQPLVVGAGTWLDCQLKSSEAKAGEKGKVKSVGINARAKLINKLPN
jgi:hypothetical protein